MSILLPRGPFGVTTLRYWFRFKAGTPRPRGFTSGAIAPQAALVGLLIVWILTTRTAAATHDADIRATNEASYSVRLPNSPVDQACVIYQGLSGATALIRSPEQWGGQINLAVTNVSYAQALQRVEEAIANQAGIRLVHLYSLEEALNLDFLVERRALVLHLQDVQASTNSAVLRVKLHFPTVPLGTILKIYEDLTGRTLIPDSDGFPFSPYVSVSLLCPEAVSAATARGLIELTLARNGIGLIHLDEKRTLMVIGPAWGAPFRAVVTLEPEVRQPEWSFRGRTVLQWMRVFCSGPRSPTALEARMALLKAGSLAEPCLTHVMTNQTWRESRLYVNLWQKLPKAAQSWLEDPQRYTQVRGNCAMALGSIEPISPNAVRALVAEFQKGSSVAAAARAALKNIAWRDKSKLVALEQELPVLHQFTAKSGPPLPRIPPPATR